MKKSILVLGVILFLSIMVSSASAARFSIGGFAGLNLPLAQDDAKSGALFGAKGRILLLPFLGLEPNFSFAQYGGKDVDDVRGKSFAQEGGDITSFGADVVLGSLSAMGKIKVYGLAGMNYNTYKREELEDESGLGLAFGPGFEFFPTEILSLEIRAKYHAIKVGEGGRVHLEVSGGINYYFGSE
jgi:hypothetical protein